LLFYNPDDFLETKSNAYNKTSLSLKIIEIDDKSKTFVIEKYLFQNYKKLGIAQSDIEKIINIARTLFPTSRAFFKYHVI
jgi:hypothetical protein